TTPSGSGGGWSVPASHWGRGWSAPRRTASGCMNRAAMIEVSGRALEPREVIAVARDSAALVLSDEARSAMAGSAAIVQRLVDSEEPVYGVSTGFGSLATTPIPAGRREELQRALIRSHAAGMGPPLEA